MQKKYYLSACCILKDEDPFVMEWLTYHSLIGVEHFFIYDNESAAPLGENPLIRKFVAQNKVTVLNAPGRQMQYPAYGHCLEHYAPLTKWLAFIDLDEFVCPLEARDLRPLLAAYEDYAALGLSWKCFGSGGHITRPQGLVLRNYRERFKKYTARNLHIKSIIQPEKNRAVHTPHSFWTNAGEAAVSPGYRFIPDGNPMMPVCWEKATVHHYLLKSQQDAQRRMERGRADIESERPTVDYDDFYRLVHEPVEPDDSIVRFAGEVEGWIRAEELPEEHAAALAGREPAELLDLAEGLMRRRLLTEAGVTLCHAALTQSENPRLWQARARLAGLCGQEDAARLFAEKAARLKLGLGSSPYPEPDPLPELGEEEAEEKWSECSALVQAGEYAAAEALLEAWARERRLTWRMRLLLGDLARRRGDFAKAEECFATVMRQGEYLQTYQMFMQLRLDERKYREARDFAFYMINTITCRAAETDFYEPLLKIYADLERLTSD